MKQGLPINPEVAAFRKWRLLLDQDYPIGTGHGLATKLADMTTEGIVVPSVLFDVCAMLHRQ